LGRFPPNLLRLTERNPFEIFLQLARDGHSSDPTLVKKLITVVEGLRMKKEILITK